MNIYLYELKSYLRSVFIWCLSMAALIFLLMSFYPTMAADAALMDEVMAAYPEEMLKAFGMDSAQSMSTLSGFFAFVYLFMQLCIAIQASNYGVHYLSVEERELTADFLMTRPVSRSRIITMKFLAVCTALTLTNAIIWASVFAAFAAFNDGKSWEPRSVAILLSTISLFQLFFVTTGMLISVAVKKIRSVLPWSIGLAFGFYMLSALGSIVDSRFLNLLSPFYHYEAEYILQHNTFNLPLLVLNVGVSAAAAITGYALYLKRNISTV